MIVATATQKMIAFYKGNLRDIDHFPKDRAMAKTVGKLEGLDSRTQEVLELAAGNAGILQIRSIKHAAERICGVHSYLAGITELSARSYLHIGQVPAQFPFRPA